MRTETPPTDVQGQAGDDLGDSVASSPGVPLATVRRCSALDLAVLASFILEVGGAVVAALLASGWITALVLDLVVGGVLVLIAARPVWRPVVGRLLAFGLVAGILELATDFAGERVAHSLVYPPGEPMLWASPIYMPLSWMIVLTQIGYLAWRLAGLVRRRAGRALVVGILGALNIAFYEEMAYSARWWHYRNTLTVAHTPVYVPAFEGLVVAVLPFLLRDIERQPWRGAIARGVILGAWMPWAALVAWLVFGR